MSDIYTGKTEILKNRQLTEINRRGKSGGQVRDEYRDEFDPGRGGFGRIYGEDEQPPER